MKQNPLYVPVELNVLLLGKSETERPLRDVFPKYDRLGENGLFGDDITNDNPVFRWGKPGAHLHWLMPDALLRGCQREDGEMEFPELPNRWIVIRLSSEGDHIRRKAWIIQSDKLSPPGEDRQKTEWKRARLPACHMMRRMEYGSRPGRTALILLISAMRRFMEVKQNHGPGWTGLPL